jgi:hypothetical protein
VPTFHALAAVFALVVLLRNAGTALRLLRPAPAAGGDEAPAAAGHPEASKRLAGLVSLLACLAALAVLAMAVRGLLLPGASP